MELFCSNIKKFLTFSYISGNGNRPNIIYISGNRNPKKLLIFREMELFSLSSKKFLYFAKWKPRKKIFIFQETEFSYISGNGNPKKTSYILGSNFPCSKNKIKLL